MSLLHPVRTARAWTRGHPRLVDGAGISPFFLGSLPLAIDTPYGWSPVVYLAIASAMCAPIAFRRERPTLVFGVVALVAFGQWLAGVQLMPCDAALFVAQYTVVLQSSRTEGILATLVMELGAVLAMAQWGAGDAFELVPATILVGSTWIGGNSVRTRRQYLAGLVERARRAEWERDTQAYMAAAAERARIARELHDVVAHNVSVMVVQADGAAYAMDTDAERARRALETISSTGRQALAEMRRLLGVLRSEGDGGAYAPQPALAQLAGLVDQVRRSGLPVDLAVEGAPKPMPQGMELAAYRVVQEALTNTLKHAGPAASARVRLRYAGEALEVRVCDDGRGAAAAPSDGQGHGLIGMRERVEMYGGSVRAGPRTGSGYEVVASLPLQAVRT